MLPVRRNIMNLMTIENVTKTFGEKKIFDNIIFGIDFGDKVAMDFYRTW